MYSDVELVFVSNDIVKEFVEIIDSLNEENFEDFEL